MIGLSHSVTDFDISGAVVVFQGLHQVMGLITPNSFEITVVARLAKLKYFLCHQCSPFLVVASLCLTMQSQMVVLGIFVCSAKAFMRNNLRKVL